MTITVESLLETGRLIEEANGPPLRSVRVHPDDYAELERQIAPRCAYPSDDVAPRGAMGLDGVLIFKDEYVERGKPWYDPPQAAQRQGKAE